MKDIEAEEHLKDDVPPEIRIPISAHVTVDPIYLSPGEVTGGLHQPGKLQVTWPADAHLHTGAHPSMQHALNVAAEMAHQAARIQVHRSLASLRLVIVALVVFSALGGRALYRRSLLATRELARLDAGLEQQSVSNLTLAAEQGGVTEALRATQDRITSDSSAVAVEISRLGRLLAMEAAAAAAARLVQDGRNEELKSVQSELGQLSGDVASLRAAVVEARTNMPAQPTRSGMSRAASTKEMANDRPLLNVLRSGPDWETPDHAVKTYPDGAWYMGGMMDGKKHGFGILCYTNGDIYRGQFILDARSGLGTYTFNDGGEYYGTFVNDIRDGEGRYQFPDGTIYTGGFKRWKKHGYGVCTYPDGARMTGYWDNDHYTGSQSNSVPEASRGFVPAREPTTERRTTGATTTGDPQ